MAAVCNCNGRNTLTSHVADMCCSLQSKTKAHQSASACEAFGLSMLCLTQSMGGWVISAPRLAWDHLGPQLLTLSHALEVCLTYLLLPIYMILSQPCCST